MIYVYSGLTGGNEIYIYALSISMGNEDYPTWTLLNKLSKRACPMVTEVERGQKYSKFVFVSDQDNGLEKSLQDVFKNNHATHCQTKCVNKVWQAMCRICFQASIVIFNSTGGKVYQTDSNN